MAGVMLALDLDDPIEALGVVKELGGAAAGYKVGSQLFCRQGPSVVDQVRGAGGRVFLDLKFHDIPNTVAKAVRAAADRGVSWLTVHASGGHSMVKAAADAAGDAKVLAVTVLTSLTPVELSRVGVEAPVGDQVLRLAELALEAGAHGVVCSPREAALLRKELGKGFLVVTPGVRPSGASKDDQDRVATPSEAVRAGADFLVVGRPVLAAPDRGRALKGILEEING